MDQQPPSHLGKASSSSSKMPKVVDDSNFSEYLKNMPTPCPAPIPERRSLRLSKYNGLYGVSLTPMQPLPPELRAYLVPPEGSISDSCRQEIMDRFDRLPKEYSPYDTSISVEEFAALEAARWYNSDKRPLPPPPLPTKDDLALLVNKYVEEGLDREAVELAVPLYFDSTKEVKDFVDGYTYLRGLGFPLSKVGQALLRCDLDKDRALEYIRR